MMEAKRALKVAETLQDAFADVTVHGTRQPVTVIAREHTGRIPQPFCQHTTVLVARDVYVSMKGRYFVSNPEIAIKAAEVFFCARCDMVDHVVWKH